MTLKEINIEISRLQVLQRQMREEETNKHKEIARKYVGKCYVSHDGRMFKIIGIPRTRLTKMESIYNEYQFPALILNYPDKLRDTYICDDDNFCPCYYDDVYFNLWDNSPKKRVLRFTEISKEAFDIRFNECINRFKKLTDEMVSEYESKTSC